MLLARDSPLPTGGRLGVKADAIEINHKDDQLWTIATLLQRVREHMSHPYNGRDVMPTLTGFTTAQETKRNAGSESRWYQ
jgi:hypothetical protein